jgi:PGF-CTERM protein
MPTWFRNELKSGETWEVCFEGKIKPDIYPGMIITSQALITADTVPILLSDNPTTPEEDDYTAVAIRLINGSITGKVEDDKYGTAITASVAIDGAVTQNTTTDDSGIYIFSDLPPGDYNVSVDAENYDYHSPTAPATVTLDGTGASIQVDFFMARKDIIPPVSSILLSADEIVQESMTEIHGTAYDYAPGSGIDKVELSIELNDDRKYWDGNSWERKETWLLALGTTEWTFKCSGIIWDSNFSYTIKSRATDNAGNVERPTVITTTSALQAPALISPVNKISVGYVPTFEWSYVLDSYYYIQIDNDRYFRSPEIDASYLTHNTYTPGEMEKGTYYWRVKAVDMERGYPVSEWSEVRTVTTTPGFETIFAIAGLLVVAFLLRRRK